MPKPFDLPERIPLEQQHGQSFAKLVELMRRLLAPDGCPWDREQDEQSLKPYVLEEACEVIDAIDSGEPAELEEELGDLALQVVFLAELGRRKGQFGPDDVLRGICEKLVRRHPHVFASTDIDSSEQVKQQWAEIKAVEKGQRPLLAGIPRSLPALLRAYETSGKVARVGFDWPDADGSKAKVEEEFKELDEAIVDGQEEQIREEFGDLLFALVNWGRHLQIHPEEALRAACDKFRARFEHVERQVQKNHGDWPRDEKGKPTCGLPLDELDQYWEQAKRS